MYGIEAGSGGDGGVRQDVPLYILIFFFSDHVTAIGFLESKEKFKRDIPSISFSS
jgi:hypothetical protein